MFDVCSVGSLNVHSRNKQDKEKQSTYTQLDLNIPQINLQSQAQ